MTSKKSIITGNMRKNRIISHIEAFLTALSMILVSLIVSLNFNSSNLSYFESYQKDNKIVEDMGVSQDKLDQINRDLTAYLKEGREELLKNHFNQREVAHMADVFKLFELAQRLMYFAIAIFVISAGLAIYKKRIMEWMKLSAKYILLILFLVGLFAILVSRNFDKAFISFHHIFFDNDLWLLDPDRDMMIRMLPQTFFSGMAFNIVRDFVSALLLIVGLVFLICRKRGGNYAIHGK